MRKIRLTMVCCWFLAGFSALGVFAQNNSPYPQNAEGVIYFADHGLVFILRQFRPPATFKLVAGRIPCPHRAPTSLNVVCTTVMSLIS